MAGLIKTFDAFMGGNYYRCNFYADDRDKGNEMRKCYYNINSLCVTKYESYEINSNL